MADAVDARAPGVRAHEVPCGAVDCEIELTQLTVHLEDGAELLSREHSMSEAHVPWDQYGVEPRIEDHMRRLRINVEVEFRGGTDISQRIVGPAHDPQPSDAPSQGWLLHDRGR